MPLLAVAACELCGPSGPLASEWCPHPASVAVASVLPPHPSTTVFLSLPGSEGIGPSYLPFLNFFSCLIRSLIWELFKNPIMLILFFKK